MRRLPALPAAIARITAGGNLARLAHKIPDRVGVELGARNPNWFYDGRVVSIETGSEVLKDYLLGDRPVAVSRLGATEQNVLRCYSGSRGRYPKYVRTDISMQSGVNPPSDEVLDRFCGMYLDAIPALDFLGTWYHTQERRLVREYLQPSAILSPLATLDPLFPKEPWSAALEGQKVCVVHPFKKSIESQYARREKLLNDQRYLPKFGLTVVEAVQALGALPAPFTSWFDALDSMSSQIESSRCDVVLIGAGAFGLPLAVRAKHAGMKAIHVGGSLQLLFGIGGARWDKSDYVAGLRNDSWVRPDSAERPPTAQKVDNASYW